MRIQVNDPHAMAHRKAGFYPSAPGLYDFPDDPAYAGWLAGKKARGAYAEVPNVDPSAPEAYGVTSGSSAPDAAPPPPREAEGLTSGSTAAKAEVSSTHPEAAGMTIGSTSGLVQQPVDEEADQAAAQVTQRGQRAGDKAKAPKKR